MGRFVTQNLYHKEDTSRDFIVDVCYIVGRLCMQFENCYDVTWLTTYNRATVMRKISDKAR